MTIVSETVATLRAARPGDLTQILELYTELHGNDPSPDPAETARRWDELLAFNGAEVIVCEEAGRLVSTCTLVVIPNITRGGRPYALIENVVTRSDCRRRGLALRTMRHALDRAWEQRCYKAMLLSGLQNTNAHVLYERLGFERTKVGFQIRNL